MPYEVIKPNVSQLPILVSVPHCGIDFPNDIADQYNPEMIDSPEDTDWFVDKLYDFVADMGITMIHAKYSRWVIDLNRDPESKPLYADGRVITGLTPTTDFNSKPLYKSEGPDDDEIKRRVDKYYTPYYNKIREILDGFQSEHDHVLFFDAHSIKQYVPGIHAEKFPDLVLGDVDVTSAHKQIVDAAYNSLASGSYTLTHNTPFKGGHLTRYFGRPENKVHALQLEMSKTVYMDDDEVHYSLSRSSSIRSLLQSMFTNLITSLDDLNSQ